MPPEFVTQIKSPGSTPLMEPRRRVLPFVWSRRRCPVRGASGRQGARARLPLPRQKNIRLRFAVIIVGRESDSVKATFALRVGVSLALRRLHRRNTQRYGSGSDMHPRAAAYACSSGRSSGYSKLYSLLGYCSSCRNRQMADPFRVRHIGAGCPLPMRSGGMKRVRAVRTG